MIRRFTAFMIGIVLLARALPLYAQENAAGPDDGLCRAQIGILLAGEHDLYRRAVFGSTGSNLLGENGGSLLRTGGIVDESDGFGILATPERMTSELIEPLVEAYRTFRCRSYSVCLAVQASLQSTEAASIEVKPLGCEPAMYELIPECMLSITGPQNSTLSTETFCARVVDDTLKFERRVLELAVAYDAGYRALLQFTGMFDAFLADAPKRMFGVLRQMMSLLGRLHQVPCFSPHCDLPPLPSVGEG